MSFQDLEWIPYDTLVRGTITGTYHVPHPSLHTGVGLQMGNPVYAFEAHKSGLWIRAYIIIAPKPQRALTQALSSSFHKKRRTSLHMDKHTLAPTVVCAVIPRDLVLFVLPSQSILYDTAHSPYIKNRKLPPLPSCILADWNQWSVASHRGILNGNLSSLIKIWLFSYVYQAFLGSDYSTVSKVLQAAQDLFEIADHIAYNLYTTSERVIACRRAVWLATQIDQALGCGVAVRNPQTGSMLCPGCVGNDAIAKEQLLYALAPEYPLADFRTQENVDQSTGSKQLLMSIRALKIVPSDQFGVSFYLASKHRRLSETFHITLSDTTAPIDLPIVWFKEYTELLVNQNLAPVLHTLYLVVEVFKQTMPMAKVAVGVCLVTDESAIANQNVQTIKLYTYSPGSRKSISPQDILTGKTRRDIVAFARFREITIALRNFDASHTEPLRRLMHTFPRSSTVFEVKSLFKGPASFDRLREDFYMVLGVLTVNVENSNSYYLKCSSSSKHLTFQETSNLASRQFWMSRKCASNEHVNQLFKILNIGSRDSVIFELYDESSRLVGTSSGRLIRNGQVVQGTHEFLLKSPNDDSVVANLIAEMFYIGNKFETDAVLRFFRTHRVTDEEIYLNLRYMRAKSRLWHAYHFEVICDRLLKLFVDNSDHSCALEIFCALIYAIENASKINEQDVQRHLAKVLKRYHDIRPLALRTIEMIDKFIQSFLDNQDDYMLPLLMDGKYVAQLLLLIFRSHEETDGKAMRNKFKESCWKLLDTANRFLYVHSQLCSEAQTFLLNSVPDFCAIMVDFLPVQTAMPQLLEGYRQADSEAPHLATARLHMLEKITNIWVDRQFVLFDQLVSVTCHAASRLWTHIGTNSSWGSHLKDQCLIISKTLNVQFRYAATCDTSVRTRLYTEFVSSLLAPCSSAYVVSYKRIVERSQLQGTKFKLVFNPPFTGQQYESRPIASDVSPPTFDNMLIELGIVFVILCSMAESTDTEWIDNLNKTDITALVVNTLEACVLNHRSLAFPNSWLSLACLHRRNTLRCLTLFKDDMASRFLGDNFEPRVWYLFLKSAMSLAHLEEVSNANMTCIGSQCSNHQLESSVSEAVADVLLDIWPMLGDSHPDTSVTGPLGLQTFGGSQGIFCDNPYSILSQVLLTIHGKSCSKLRQAAVDILFSLAVHKAVSLCNELEEFSNEALKPFSHEIIHIIRKFKEQNLIQPDSVDKVRMRACFDLATSRIEDSLQIGRALKWVMNLTMNFIELNLDLMSIPEGECYNSIRFFHSVNCFNFLRSIDFCPDICALYISSIVTRSLASGNEVRAALAYGLLAPLFSWSTDSKIPIIDSLQEFRGSTSFEVKEELYSRMADHFKNGNALEYAVDATKELMKGYETVADYAKLSLHAGKLADIYLAIETRGRLHNQYFRVQYIGQAFPRMLQGKQFILEGTPWEDIDTVKAELLTLYPTATIVDQAQQAQDDLQCILVNGVEPILASDYHIGNWDLSSSGARMYLDRLYLQSFKMYRLVKARMTDGHVIADYVEATTYVTKSRFPSILGQSEIIEQSQIELPLAEGFIEQLFCRRLELDRMNTLYLEGKALDYALERLEFCLRRSICEPVHGGVEVIRIAMRANLARSASSPTDVSALFEVLDTSLLDLVAVIRTSLAIFHDNAKNKDENRRYKNLLTLFSSTYAEETALVDQLEKRTNLHKAVKPLSKSKAALTAKSWFKAKIH